MPPARCASGWPRTGRRRSDADAATVRFANGHGAAAAAQQIAFDALVAQAYTARVQLWSDGFYATPGLHWNRETLKGKPFFYFAYGAGLRRGDHRHADRRAQGAARRRAARRGPQPEPGHRHRPGGRRLHPGHGLADDGRAALASADGQAADARAQHLQDPHRQRLPGAFRRAAVRGRDRRQPGCRHHPPQQGGGRAAAAAAVQCVPGHP